MLHRLSTVLLPGFIVALLTPAALAAEPAAVSFKRVSSQFIAALAEPDATSGDGAERWGIWRDDPGPRGVWLKHYDALQADGGEAPAGWRFDPADWWLEENGMIMEKPEFPLPPGRYRVTGGRRTMSVLTVHEPDASGSMQWELADGATLYDVTHLGCRSARYWPEDGQGIQGCSPANAPIEAFRVEPGAAMPAVPSCAKQDYAVLFIVGIAVE